MSVDHNRPKASPTVETTPQGETEVASTADSANSSPTMSSDDGVSVHITTLSNAGNSSPVTKPETQQEHEDTTKKSIDINVLLARFELFTPADGNPRARLLDPVGTESVATRLMEPVMITSESFRYLLQFVHFRLTQTTARQSELKGIEQIAYVEALRNQREGEVPVDAFDDPLFAMIYDKVHKDKMLSGLTSRIYATLSTIDFSNSRGLLFTRDYPKSLVEFGRRLKQLSPIFEAAGIAHAITRNSAGTQHSFRVKDVP